MSDLPSSVIIGPMRYTIVRVSNMHQERHDLDGVIHYNTETIDIDSGLSNRIAVQTLWHEILHAILQHAGRRKHSEKWIDSTAYGLMQVIAENPELVELTRDVIAKSVVTKK